MFNIPIYFRNQDLLHLFKPFGRTLGATVFVDKSTGRSKCFGFVSFDNAQASQHAIANMNGAEINGEFGTLITLHNELLPTCVIAR